MADHIEVPGPSSSLGVVDPGAPDELAGEHALVRTIIRSIFVAVPVMIAFWVLLVAIAVSNKDPEWAAWLGMAAVIGLLAGLFFGAWVGFVRNAHALDDADLPLHRSHPSAAPSQSGDLLVPERPQEAGVVPPLHQRIEDIEGERLLENEARARLRDDGFTDAQILLWVEAFFAERHEGDVEELVEWIREQEGSGLQPERSSARR